MARPAAHQKLVVSILDRLIDQEPEGLARAAGRARRATWRRSRPRSSATWSGCSTASSPCSTRPADLRHLRRSLLTFGLPDFTVASLSSTKDQDVLRRAIEETVRRFEPRLADVTVRLEAGREFDRSLRFRIDGMLQVDPAPEPVTFDSVLQLNTRDFVVQGE